VASGTHQHLLDTEQRYRDVLAAMADHDDEAGEAGDDAEAGVPGALHAAGAAGGGE